MEVYGVEVYFSVVSHSVDEKISSKKINFTILMIYKEKIALKSI